MAIDDDLRRLINGMREQDAAAAFEATQFHTWTEAETVRALDPTNAEVLRLTSAPVADPEVERLSKIAQEEQPKN